MVSWWESHTNASNNYRLAHRTIEWWQKWGWEEVKLAINATVTSNNEPTCSIYWEQAAFAWWRRAASNQNAWVCARIYVCFCFFAAKWGFQETPVQDRVMRKAKRVLLNTHGTQLPEEQKEEEDLRKSPQHVHRRREVSFTAHRAAIIQLLGVRACVFALCGRLGCWRPPATPPSPWITRNRRWNLILDVRSWGRWQITAELEKVLTANLLIRRLFIMIIDVIILEEDAGSPYIYVCDTYSINMH